jgi:hypothetical protein
MKEIADKYLGQKEITPNWGFLDKIFDAKMRSVGFYNGAPWCMFFCKLVWQEAGLNVKMISGSSKQTMINATKNENWHTTPVVGSIVIFRLFNAGKPTNLGHGAIVTEITEDGYITVDGNTSDKNGREGIMVAIRKRHLNQDSWRKKNGLRLMGFIHPLK